MTTQQMLTEHGDNSSTRKGRRTLLILFLVGALPVLASFTAYLSGFGVPAERSNRGEFILPPVSIAGLGMQDALSGEPVVFEPEQRWLVFVAGAGECAARCRQVLHDMRQVHTALGRQTIRVRRAYLVDSAAAAESVTGLRDAYPGLRLLTGSEEVSARLSGAIRSVELAGDEIYIADPLGNVMLYYTAEHEGRDLLEDLRRLLKVSKIG